MNDETISVHKCLVCGKENDGCLCNKCRAKTDIENLCNRIIEYIPLRVENPNANPLWDDIAGMINPPYRFQDLAKELAEYLPYPRREYQIIHSISGEYSNIPRAKHDIFFEEYRKCVDSDGLSEFESFRLKGLMLSALYMDYRYYEAEEVADTIIVSERLPRQTLYSLADYYIKTRRYDIADSILSLVPEKPDNDLMSSQFIKLKQDCNKYRQNAENGKKEYMPNPRENKDETVGKYVEFLSFLGMDIQKPQKVPKPIPVEEYPVPIFIDEPRMDSFVAYDFETTGLSSARDCIIEIGAVKVVDGIVDGSSRFIFSEFVKPFKRSVTDEISKITGITQDDVRDARPMWDVIPDFMDFVGDNPLVGYNNATFDSKFLVRAGRYSNLIIRNLQFDVLKYVRTIRKNGDFDSDNTKLETVSRALGIDNPSAHRAWADALTTAKVYMKLYNKDY